MRLFSRLLHAHFTNCPLPSCTTKESLVAYDLLIIAFGVGVWVSSATRRLRLVGNLLMAVGLVGLVVVPSTPMHLRGMGSLATDAPHIAVTAVLVLVVLLNVGSGASVFGGGFRLY
jgi:hypothetical protein